VRRSGLGRGLGALIPTEAAGGASLLQEIPVAAIEPNPNQPRVHFDEEALLELTASIREVGVLQPILVRPVDEGRYQLVAGERRWRAARRAGLATVPALVRDSDDLASVEHALVENLHRQDLSALEEGKSRAAVSNTLRLLQLPPSIQHLLADGSISAGHARALLGTPDRAYQEALAKRTVAEGLSVRAVEEAVREHVAHPPAAVTADGRSIPRPLLRPPGLLELEELLSAYLDTRVSVSMGAKKGKVVVEFATLEDLERIYRLITEAPPA
jgi:ParB family chromosome partitioning protein